jgi:23S rRNA (pseudouridine1915-N3)-methyltransferase
MKFHTTYGSYSRNWTKPQILEDFAGDSMRLGGRDPDIAFCDILLNMQVTLAHIGSRAVAKDACDQPVREYLERCAGFMRCGTEAFRSEKALLDWMGKLRGRTEAVLMLLDGRGRLMTSEALAAWLGERRDEGMQHLVFAIGPADGWSDEARAEVKRRGGLLSLGPMTLAHSLARLVMAEQLYRACTILTGHPYHRGQ